MKAVRVFLFSSAFVAALSLARLALESIAKALFGESMMLKCCSVTGVLLAALLGSTPSRALTIDFSFTNDIGSVGGTVTGEIEGLVDNTFSPSTDVIVLTAPAALGLNIPPPLDTFSQPAGTFTLFPGGGPGFIMSGGVITNGGTDSINYQLPFFSINWGFCLSLTGECAQLPFGAPPTSGPPVAFLIGPGGVVATDQLPTFTVATTPLPAALPLFAGGLGVIGLFGARKRRKAQAA